MRWSFMLGTLIPVLALAGTPADATDAASGVPPLDWERRIADIDDLLATAHFKTALTLARSSLEQLDRAPSHGRAGAWRARLEVIAATAAVALGDRSGARQHLQRALRADPTLDFDPARTSPKLLELVPESRRRPGLAEARP